MEGALPDTQNNVLVILERKLFALRFVQIILVKLLYKSLLPLYSFDSATFILWVVWKAHSVIEMLRQYHWNFLTSKCRNIVWFSMLKLTKFSLETQNHKSWSRLFVGLYTACCSFVVSFLISSSRYGFICFDKMRSN